MKKNTNLKKNLVKKSVLPAAFAVLGSAIALTSVSYAWFTQGDQASLDTIDVNVATADGLQLSTGKGEWKSLLTLEDLKTNAGLVLPDGKGMNPVSTTNTINGAGSLDVYKGSVTVDNYYVSEKVTKGGANFLEFDIYAKLDAKANLFLDTDSEIVPTGDSTAGIEDCVRVAFIDMGSTEKLDTTVSISDNKNPNKGASAIIWEQNKKNHSTEVTDFYGTNNPVGNIDNSYYGFKAEFAEGLHLDKAGLDSDNEKGGSSQYVSTVTTYDTDALKSTQPIAVLEKGYNKLRILVWVEGQDVDTINANAGKTFSTILKFKKTNIV